MTVMNRFRSEQEGVALITALLAVVILSGMAVVFFARAQTETRASGFSRDHETVLHIAEAASDQQIGFINLDDVHVTRDLAGDVIAIDPASIGDEEAWARGLVLGEGASGVEADAWMTTDAGEAYAVRPFDTTEDAPMQVIYAVGAIPSFDADNARIRVLKLQIARDRFVPRFALLTDAGLPFAGNASIEVPGCDTSTQEQAELTCVADVHTNGGFTSSGSSSLIEGRVSQATGTCPNSVTAVNGCVDAGDGVEAKIVPRFEARSFYNRAEELNSDRGGQDVGWFDLCPPNKPVPVASVREPSASGPCTGTQIWPDATSPSSDFRGWSWQAGQWRGSAIGAGAFYVYHADAKVTGTSGSVIRAVSIFAEQDPSNKGQSGSIDLSGNPKMEPAVESLLLVADADLDLQGNATVGICDGSSDSLSGFIGVGEQLKTQGTVELRGAIIVQDLDDAHGLVRRNTQGLGGTMCLEFDPNLVIDFVGLWVITYWNEF